MYLTHQKEATCGLFVAEFMAERASSGGGGGGSGGVAVSGFGGCAAVSNGGGDGEASGDVVSGHGARLAVRMRRGGWLCR